jgi:O-acetyl-ADP-ribose deacetylase (regulator of RNase III)
LSRIEDIEAGLDALVVEVRRRGIRSIAIPPLGAGLGGLKWAEVRPRIEQAFLALPDVRVAVFEPRAAVEPVSRVRKIPAMTPGRSCSRSAATSPR